MVYTRTMRILGIDPGIGRTGWGIVDVAGAKLIVKDYGCIETFKDKTLSERLLILYTELQKVFEAHQPEMLSIEELFFNTNTTTAITVGQARGVVLLAAAQHGISVTSYTPLQVKMAVTGYGRADKKQVGQMIKTILRLQQIPKLDDTADALAIAVTHAFSYKMK